MRLRRSRVAWLAALSKLDCPWYGSMPCRLLPGGVVARVAGIERWLFRAASMDKGRAACANRCSLFIKCPSGGVFIKLYHTNLLFLVHLLLNRRVLVRFSLVMTTSQQASNTDWKMRYFASPTEPTAGVLLAPTSPLKSREMSHLPPPHRDTESSTHRLWSRQTSTETKDCDQSTIRPCSTVLGGGKPS